MSLIDLSNYLHVQEACFSYLPEHKGDSEVYGKIRVQLVSKETTTDYVIQQLEVSEDKPPHKATPLPRQW